MILLQSELLKKLFVRTSIFFALSVVHDDDFYLLFVQEKRMNARHLLDYI
jgi:hypothetical protein